MKLSSCLVAVLLAASAPAMANGVGGPSKAPAQMMNPQNVQQGFDLIKQRLNLTPAQEGPWETFAKASRMEGPRTFPNFSKATTVLEFMDMVESMQQQTAAKFSEQKKATAGLYNVLNAEQKKTFDQLMLGGFNTVVPSAPVPR